MPQVIIDEWLPNEDESVLFLFQEFNQYPLHPSHYILPSNLQSVLHQDGIQSFNYQSLLTIGPPVLPSIPKVYQNAIKKSQYPIHSVTLRPYYGDPVRLPAWVFDYWVEIGHAVDIRKQWKVALIWVSGYSTLPMAMGLYYQLLLGFSSLSWLHSAAYTGDITPLLSSSPVESHLSSFHIDYVIAQIKAQHGKTYGASIIDHHIFVIVNNFNTIIHFYGNICAKKEGYLWDALMVIENRIIMGNVDSLGDVMDLPLHWVSVVVNFQQQQILYGDSLGRKIPGGGEH